jgi:hypothetical protein
MFTKLSAISMPATPNVQSLCRESVANHGTDDSNHTTDVPRPTSTSNDGNAQHRRVLSDVNREK